MKNETNTFPLTAFALCAVGLASASATLSSPARAQQQTEERVAAAAPRVTVSQAVTEARAAFSLAGDALEATIGDWPPLRNRVALARK